MSEAKHTAAPWAFEAEETSSGPMFSVYDSRGQRLTEPYIDEQKARLIAAAPELFAACEAMLACAQSTSPEMTAAYEQASAALSKAGGRS